ncbi:MAG: DUF1553 domain-containing protein [Verrucomicrobia bacterium]|nr:DUF1553 domain-containing protein [Verrucomicrobiota bacterium]
MIASAHSMPNDRTPDQQPIDRFGKLCLLPCCFAWILLCSALTAHSASSSTIDFGRQILPILSDNCYACHGPDDQARKGGLRLDHPEDAFKPAKSGKPTIVPGKPEESELLKRLHTTDPDDAMPPEKFGKKLSEGQKALLKQWIAQGATWKQHWAFTPPVRPVPPPTRNTSWARNNVDRFILSRLEREGIKPSKEADPVTLIRRASLDLTGLPPSPDEVEAFRNDKRPDAYERLIERLMKSPRYGEHMAKYWLDAARYADSHGYHIDAERHMWKYRDWVIDAYNKNMPFDQFTIEQLAGDLLPEPSVDQKVASGYVRANMSTGEGGAIVDEYQAKYTFDRTETTSTIWMGLTMTCARCHTHKYDPITHREYFGLYSFFNNLKEAVMDGNTPNPDPAIQVPSPDQKERLDSLRKWIAEGKTKVERAMPEIDEAQTAWEKSWRTRLAQAWTVSRPQSFTATSNAQHQILDDKSVLVTGPNPPQDIYSVVLRSEAGPFAGLRLEALPDDSLPQKSSSRADDGIFRLSEFEADYTLPGADGKPGETKSLKFSQAIADATVKDREADKAIDGKPETGWQAFSAASKSAATVLFLLKEPMQMPEEVELRLRMKFQASVNKRAIGRFRISSAQSEDLAYALAPPKPDPWHVLGALKAGNPIETLNSPLDPEKKVDLKQTFQGVREEARWNAKADLEDGKNHVLVSSLHGVHGIYYLTRNLNARQEQTVEISVRADDVFRIWVNQEQVGERLVKEKPGEGPLKTTVRLKKGDNQILIKAVNVQGNSRFQFSMSPMDESILPPRIAVLLASPGQMPPDQQTELKNHFRRVKSPEWRKDNEQLAAWREEESGLNKAIPTTLVAREEMEKPRETRILMRGEYDKTGDVVGRGTPAVLPPFPKDSPTNRLGLARWLLMPSHPLTARVTVNRFWQQFFAVGIVKTSEDFGVQSEAPSHPELLDWLATEFITSGWDVQKVQKTILLSAAYRQESRHRPEVSARDPENRLIARGPRFRVDGEMIRDTALYVSGLLVEKQGGRSVKPFEPSGLWEAVSFNNSQKYVVDEGDALYRRSLYTHWKRQSPPPNMLLFDAPTREYCVVKRPRTNTPLQALALLNDPQFVEASRAFADRMLKDGGRNDESRLRYGFRRATGRPPTKAELDVLKESLAVQRAAFMGKAEEASKFLKVGNFAATSDATAEELAAWSAVASMILNLDETLTKI